MRRCESCRAEPGSFHTPCCENKERDARGRFWPGTEPIVPHWKLPSPRPEPDMKTMSEGEKT